jgi:restriction system protein
MAQFAPDGVPTIDGCRPVVLRVLTDGQERKLSEIVRLVAQDLHLSDEVVAQKVSSGQGRLANRVGWACSAFYQAGLLARPRRGTYRITDDGRVVAARNLLEYSEKDMDEWPKWRAYQEEVAERSKRSTLATSGGVPGSSVVGRGPGSELVDDGTDPLEAVAGAVQGMNDAVETELRVALQTGTPEFFERAVLEVLWAMGYGGANGDKERLGKSHDGGIDGVIRQDPLGLQEVYVQAKRYADGNTVGSPEINGFYGALAGRGADRGVFITTSAFTPAAKRAAEQFNGRIVLIDGIRLTSLMLAYGVGVERRERFTVFQVDGEWFED